VNAESGSSLLVNSGFKLPVALFNFLRKCSLSYSCSTVSKIPNLLYLVELTSHHSELTFGTTRNLWIGRIWWDIYSGHSSLRLLLLAVRD
jgi:hypothetical protein